MKKIVLSIVSLFAIFFCAADSFCAPPPPPIIKPLEKYEFPVPNRNQMNFLCVRLDGHKYIVFTANLQTEDANKNIQTQFQTHILHSFGCECFSHTNAVSTNLVVSINQ